MLASTRRRSTHLVAAMLLALFFVSGTSSLLGKSATFDETAHLPAGVSYWQTGDFRLNPEHPPLAKLWTAAPVAALGLLQPRYDSWAWIGMRETPDGRRTGASEWLFGYEALNGAPGDEARLDPRPALIAGRNAMMVWGVLLGLLLWRVSRKIWGEAGGLVSLAMYCISPTMLAHSRWVTTDLPAALGLFALVAAVCAWAENPGWRKIPWVALASAFFLGVKFSAVALVPIVISVALPIAWAHRKSSVLKQWLGMVAVSALFCLASIWLLYGMRTSATEQNYAVNWEIVGSADSRWTSEDRPLNADIVMGLLDAGILPEGYLYGLAYVLGGATRRLAYLNGEISITGWWHYFLQAFLFKTPPAFLALFGWSWIRIFAGRRGVPPSVSIPLVVVLFYVGLSLTSSLNIGHRHLVPIYPLLFLLAGNLGELRRGARRWFGGLLAIAAISFVLATPHYLSYFNLFAGGQAGGWRHLLDSNLDWGQDLPALKRWMDREGVDRIHLAYFGTADPSAYGIAYDKVLRIHDFDDEQPPVPFPPSGSLLAISGNFLGGLYLEGDRSVAEAMVRRGWATPGQLQPWLTLREWRSREGRDHPSLLEWLVDENLVTQSQQSEIEAGLLSTRISKLRNDAPLARPAPSIFVYRVP